MFILLLTLGTICIGVSIAFTQTGESTKSFVAMFLGICCFVSSTVLGFFNGYDAGKLAGLVDSDRYEIVSNEDYSLKELKTFKKVNGHYLKEVM